MSKLYRKNLTLLTDLYQLTMANGYWTNRMHDHEAVFHLFFRRHPFKGNYTVACGLAQAIDYLQDLKFEVDDIQYLGSLKSANGEPLFSEGFLNYLQRMTFSCDIDAVPEGTVVFPHQPLIRVKGPLIQAQLIETALLNIINFQTLIATKASRIAAAALDDSVLEFGLRRAQGIDGGISASRAAYIGGCAATSNVLAGRLYGIPVKGTHAHSWVMSFDDELMAFRAYSNAMPNNCVFLVDTFDTIEGVKKAILVGNRLRARGYEMNGIRLDSGDLAALSIEARKLLDEAGFENASIVASNDLDEYRIKTLKEKGAKINVWGVGTRLATAYDQPALGGVYKLAAIRKPNEDWQYRIKLSENPIKVSNPGVLQTRRFFKNKQPVMDCIYNVEHPDFDTSIDYYNTSQHTTTHLAHKDLLVPIFEKGTLVYHSPDIHTIRANTLGEVSLFKNIDIGNYSVGLADNLYTLKNNLMQQFGSIS